MAKRKAGVTQLRKKAKAIGKALKSLNCSLGAGTKKTKRTKRRRTRRR